MPFALLAIATSYREGASPSHILSQKRSQMGSIEMRAT